VYKGRYAAGLTKSWTDFLAAVAVGLTLVVAVQWFLQRIQPNVDEMTALRQVENELRRLRTESWLHYLKVPKWVELLSGLALFCGGLVFPWIAARQPVSKSKSLFKFLRSAWTSLLVFCSFTYFGTATGVTSTDLTAKLNLLQTKADGLMRDVYSECDRIAREAAVVRVLDEDEDERPPVAPLLPGSPPTGPDTDGPNGGPPAPPRSRWGIKQLLKTANDLKTETVAAEKLGTIDATLRQTNSDWLRSISNTKDQLHNAHPQLSRPAVENSMLSVHDLEEAAGVLKSERPAERIPLGEDLSDIIDRSSQAVYEQSLKRGFDTLIASAYGAAGLGPMSELVKALIDQFVQTPAKEKAKQIGREAFVSVLTRTLDARSVHGWIVSRLRREPEFEPVGRRLGDRFRLSVAKSVVAANAIIDTSQQTRHMREQQLQAEALVREQQLAEERRRRKEEILQRCLQYYEANLCSADSSLPDGYGTIDLAYGGVEGSLSSGHKDEPIEVSVLGTNKTARLLSSMAGSGSSIRLPEGEYELDIRIGSDRSREKVRVVSGARIRMVVRYQVVAY
jgi:hypothetical protein